MNTNLQQQLPPTKTYEKCKLQQHLDDLNCRMCSQKQETDTHIMSACPKIAQSLYTARHDKMRPYCHYLLSTYGFKEESDHKRPWYQQRSPMPVIANSLAKLNWNIEFYMEKKRRKTTQKKVEISVMDKEKKTWLLI